MQLTELFHHKWAVRVMARLHERNGERFVVLCRQLGASDGGMRRTLAYLIKIGWVMRNPGYGHPMRPEYILTEAGKPVGEICEGLTQHSQISSLLNGKWQLPTLRFLGERLSFSELKAHLPGPTDRALSLALKALLAAEAIIRTVTQDFPPQTRYEAISELKPVVDLLEQLESVLELD